MAGWITQRKRYREYKARTAQLPANYHVAIEALERYLLCFGPSVGDNVQAMLDDLAEMFEQGVAAGTSVRALVGEDPVEFAEEFLRNYPDGQWITQERARLTSAIDSAAGAS